MPDPIQGFTRFRECGLGVLRIGIRFDLGGLDKRESDFPGSVRKNSISAACPRLRNAARSSGVLSCIGLLGVFEIVRDRVVDD